MRSIVMLKSPIFIFASGRIATFLIAVVFQLVVVRLLPATEYALVATALIVTSLAQSVSSVGIPRIIPRFFAPSGARSRAFAAFLMPRLFAVRIGLGSIVATILLWGMSALGGRDYSWAYYLLSIAAFLGPTVLYDFDAIAVAKHRQAASRAVLVSEVGLRLCVLVILALLGLPLTAVHVLAVCAVTAALGALALGLVVWPRREQRGAGHRQDWRGDLRELWSVSAGGYAGALAWLVTSPATTRAVAGIRLDVSTFAGFSFVQSFVLNLQRYTPGFLLFPFIEAHIMRALGRQDAPLQMRALLSLAGKLDLLAMGAVLVVGASIGRPGLEALTGGKYGEAFIFLPSVLLLVFLNTTYKGFEIAATAEGAAKSLVWSLPLSFVFIFIMWALLPSIGVWALILVPPLDGIARLLVIHAMLSKRGVRPFVDLTKTVGILTIVTAWSLFAWMVSPHLKGASVVLLALANSLGYAATIWLLSPLRDSEFAFISARLPQAAQRFVQRGWPAHG